MVDFDYLVRGLHAMARAHRVSPMSGHLGAAVVAGYFIGEQHPSLDERVYRGVESELQRVIAGESVFSPRTGPLTTAKLFEPLDDQSPGVESIDVIANALSANIDRVRQSGHNVIFSAIAIRALKDHPDLATPEVVGGIRRLIARFNGASPGSGYYGKAKGRIDGRRVALPEDGSVPTLVSLEMMASLVIDELVRRPEWRREGFGGMHHIINHASALTELANYGYRKLALSGLGAFREHLRLFLTLPNVAAEKGAETPTMDDPLSPTFWIPERIRRERAHLTHRIKTIYGFETLIELVEDADVRQQARENLRYLM